MPGRERPEQPCQGVRTTPAGHTPRASARRPGVRLDRGPGCGGHPSWRKPAAGMPSVWGLQGPLHPPQGEDGGSLPSTLTPALCVGRFRPQLTSTKVVLPPHTVGGRCLVGSMPALFGVSVLASSAGSRRHMRPACSANGREPCGALLARSGAHGSETVALTPSAGAPAEEHWDLKPNAGQGPPPLGAPTRGGSQATRTCSLIGRKSSGCGKTQPLSGCFRNLRPACEPAGAYRPMVVYAGPLDSLYPRHKGRVHMDPPTGTCLKGSSTPWR